MKSDERYDAKEAYNKNLSSKARMHYLENDIADRKGHSGTYSGNHPRYSKGMSMMGQAKADLTYNPTDDIAGQGTEGVNTGMMMKNMSPMQNMNKGYGQQVGKPSVASRQKYGGNKGDESMSKRDYSAPTKMYGGKKGDMSKSRRDYK
jgi:hypothetical protein